MTPRSPRVARWIVSTALPPGAARDTILGDLDEEFRARAAASSRRRARARYWRATFEILFGYTGTRWRHRRRFNSAVQRTSPMRLDGLWADLIYATRTLRRRRSLAITGIVTLGLGIAAVSLVFSVFDAVVLRAIPGPYGDRLMKIGFTSPTEGPSKSSLTHAGVDEVAARKDVFDVAASWQRVPGVVWSNQGTDVDLLAFGVSPRYFDLFGVPAEIGRTFAPNDHQPGKSAVVVLADRFWRAELGADPAGVGRVLTLNHQPTQVVGVMPASFDIPNVNVQAWIPDVSTAEEVSRNTADHSGIGRLREGLSVEQANERLARVLPQRSVDYGIDLVFAVIPLRDQLVGPSAEY